MAEVRGLVDVDEFLGVRKETELLVHESGVL